MKESTALLLDTLESQIQQLKQSLIELEKQRLYAKIRHIEQIDTAEIETFLEENTKKTKAINAVILSVNFIKSNVNNSASDQKLELIHELCVYLKQKQIKNSSIERITLTQKQWVAARIVLEQKLKEQKDMLQKSKNNLEVRSHLSVFITFIGAALGSAMGLMIDIAFLPLVYVPDIAALFSAAFLFNFALGLGVIALASLVIGFAFWGLCALATAETQEQEQQKSNELQKTIDEINKEINIFDKMLVMAQQIIFCCIQIEPKMETGTNVINPELDTAQAANDQNSLSSHHFFSNPATHNNISSRDCVSSEINGSEGLEIFVTRN